MYATGTGMAVRELLKNKALNGWTLFCLITVPVSLATMIEMAQVGLATPQDVSHMIGYSVRFAVPIIFLVVGLSALQRLFPGPIPAWLLRNRRYIGLGFAVAMAWQGAFIFLMSNFNREYYFDEIFYLRDELEGSTGYIFLTVMVLTSFQFGRKWLTPRQWNALHTTALYFLWAYPFSVYWWALSYYPNPQPIDYVFYWFGFTAFALRIAAWGMQRAEAGSAPTTFKIAGGAILATGLLVAATGRAWHAAPTAILTTPAWSANMELWLPYWPLEPFLSLLIIGLGTFVMTHTGSHASDVVEQGTA